MSRKRRELKKLPKRARKGEKYLAIKGSKEWHIYRIPAPRRKKKRKKKK